MIAFSAFLYVEYTLNHKTELKCYFMLLWCEKLDYHSSIPQKYFLLLPAWKRNGLF